MKKEDLTGKRFGYIEILRHIDEYYITPKGKKYPLVECKCHACGKVYNARTDRIRRNKSCGCAKVRCKPVDLIGKKFGRLTVVSQGEDWVYPNGTKRVQWLCKCDCGNETLVRANALKSGGTRSCGCLQKENNSKLPIQNNYDLHSCNYGLLQIGEYCVKFDKDVYNKIKSYQWHIGSDGYVTSRHTKLHKLILEGDIIDHINKDKLDNRKENLRACTTQQNNQNMTLKSINKSGITGVNKIENKWRAYITINKKWKFLGCYLNKEDAIKARLKAEKELFGEFAPQRHLFKQYRIE